MIKLCNWKLKPMGIKQTMNKPTMADVKKDKDMEDDSIPEDVILSPRQAKASMVTKHNMEKTSLSILLIR